MRADAFGPWLESASPTFTWSWEHLRHYQGQLDRVTRGELRKLIVSMPPRHGKTECGTIRYPVYRLERDPTTRVILAAYNATLACKFSRKARRLAMERFSIATDRKAVEDWETPEGGGVRAVGVGSGITGMGGDLILIDDPVKSREEAESEAFRERVWDWYTDDLYTRLEPGGAIVITMTRWHVDDLAGRILESDDGPNWTVINFPALAEADDPLCREVGEALCPDRYDAEALEDRRRVLGEDGFVSLFQGKPRPAEGGRFKSSWFRYWEHVPETNHYRLLHHDREPELVLPGTCNVFATVDSAVSEKTSADYTVISVWAVTRRADLLLIDRVRGRMNDPDAIDAMKRVHERYKPSYFAVEANGVGKARCQNARAKGLPIREVDVHTDKIARSATAVVRCQSGQLFWPRDARDSWLREWEREHLDFPGAPHDDQVDTTSLAANDLYNAMAGTVVGAESVAPDRPTSGTRRWESLGGRGERRFGR